MQAGVSQGGVISPVFFTFYVNDILTLCRHIELAQYDDDTALVATSGSMNVFIMYLETYLIALERWLREWRIVINVDKSMAMPFSPPWRFILNPCGPNSPQAAPGNPVQVSKQCYGRTLVS